MEYAVGYRGACHLQHMSHMIEQGLTDHEEAGFKADYDGPSSDGKAEMVVLSQNIGAPSTSACLCLFVYDCISVKDFAEMIHVVTGWDFTRRSDKNGRKNLAADARRNESPGFKGG